MHTEIEAAKLWCPQGRAFAAVNGKGPRNRERDGKPAVFCLASGCAMWRWVESRRMNGTKDAIDRGFCGLAGQPRF